MRYNFQCDDCKVVEEVVMPMAEAKFDPRVCPYCKGVSKHKITGAPGIITSNMTNQTIDVTVGREAESRWSDINKRQELRNKVRRDSGQQGVSMVARNEFKPLDKLKKEIRTNALKEAHKSGKQVASESDYNLLKKTR